MTIRRRRGSISLFFPSPCSPVAAGHFLVALAEKAMDVFSVTCHCGRVKGRFRCNSTVVQALDCNCSDCGMRRNVHVIVPSSHFMLDMEESLEDATILYQWGTKTALRNFCRTCGILPWYRPRSNPDGVAITIYCVDWTKGGTRESPQIEIESFDGIHWEDAMKEHNVKGRPYRISERSKS